MDYQDLLFQREDGVALVTLNRPDRLNAISPRLIHELLDVIESTERDDATRVVVITGAGRGFCAGADLAATLADRVADVQMDEAPPTRARITTSHN